MSTTQLHRLRSLLAVIRGGIETKNLAVSIQALNRVESELSNCVCDQPAAEDEYFDLAPPVNR